MLFGLEKLDDKLRLKPIAILERQLSIKTSFINPYTQGWVLALIGSGRIDMSSMNQ